MYGRNSLKNVSDARGGTSLLSILSIAQSPHSGQPPPGGKVADRQSLWRHPWPIAF